jgi:V/A-type H+/Na+-transporting ATPase subunit E
MQTLETESDKLQKIADALRRETLQPAEEEAGRLIAEAKSHAEAIVEEARKEAASIHESNRQAMEQERSVFNTSLEQGAKQSLEALRQAIEEKFLRQGLAKALAKGSSDPKLIASMIEALVSAVEKGGIETRLEAVIPKCVKPEEVNGLLGKELLAKLEEGSVTVGDFDGGVEVKLVDGEITLDMTDATLREMLGRYVRKDFREKFFSA